jgi:hypothetical protein
MRTVATLRHVPWTCLWGRFGEPVPSSWPTLSPRFVFWICAHRDAESPLTRDSCKQCRRWLATSSLQTDRRV